jgi:hypothetical protein
MPHSNTIALVKEAMIEHVQVHGEFIDDKDYEQWFVKYYLHFSQIQSNHPTSSKKKQSRSMWSPENLKWMPK